MLKNTYLAALHTFVHVAHHTSFSSAGKSLHITTGVKSFCCMMLCHGQKRTEIMSGCTGRRKWALNWRRIKATFIEWIKGRVYRADDYQQTLGKYFGVNQETLR